METGCVESGESVFSVSQARSSLAQFMGFAVAGGVATAVNYTLFLSLYSAGLFYLLASALGYLSGIVISFLINLRMVFRPGERSRGLFARYAIAYLLALFAQLGLLELLVSAGLIPEVANAVAIVVVLVGNFFVIRRWVFNTTPT